MNRIMLSALVIAFVVLVTRQWQASDWWWVGGGAAVLVVLLGWWRGAFLTTIVRRWFGLLRRNRRRRRNAGHAEKPTDARTTVLLEIERREGLPLATITSYLDRYGVRCAGIKVTESEPGHRTWVSLTLSAADNLAALLARSPEMPLQQTAQVVQRRLAGHLREQGWAVRLVDATDVSWPAATGEQWRGVRVEGGYLAAYRVAAVDTLAETLAHIRAYPALRKWTVLEMTGDHVHPAVSVGCALLTEDGPEARSRVDGFTPCSGDHGPALEALDPSSTALLSEQECWRAGRFDGLDALARLSQVPQVVTPANA